MTSTITSINNLKAGTEHVSILKGVDMVLEAGKTHVLMGRNGSGKSTLAQVLMGNPMYEVSDGEILFNGQNILEMEPDERAHAGIFLSFQYPSEIPGVSIINYLRMIYNKRFNEKLTPVRFRKLLKEKLDMVGMEEEMVNRYLNDGFSGGEKKRMEILQMLVMEPKLAILDELDSGLDIDAIKDVSNAVNILKERNNMTILLITHYTRILKYIEPDKVFIMQDGKIVQEGDKALAHKLEEQGYAPFGE